MAFPVQLASLDQLALPELQALQVRLVGLGELVQHRVL